MYSSNASAMVPSLKAGCDIILPATENAPEVQILNNLLGWIYRKLAAYDLNSTAFIQEVD